MRIKARDGQTEILTTVYMFLKHNRSLRGSFARSYLLCIYDYKGV